MVKSLIKVGNSNAIVLDRTIMNLLGLTEKGQVKLTVSGGSLIVTPVAPSVVDEKRFAECLDEVVADRREVLRRLAQ